MSHYSLPSTKLILRHALVSKSTPFPLLIVPIIEIQKFPVCYGNNNRIIGGAATQFTQDLQSKLLIYFFGFRPRVITIYIDANLDQFIRSEERRVGKACASRCESWLVP